MCYYDSIRKRDGSEDLSFLMHDAMAEEPGKELIMAEKKATKKPAEKTFEKFKARVVGGNLNVRKKPDMEADVAKVLKCDETVEVIGKAEGWYQIKGGWIMAQFTERI